MEPEIASHIASVVNLCGGDTGEFFICYSAQGWLNATEVLDWAAGKREVLLVDALVLSDAQRFVNDYEIESNVLVASDEHSILTYRGIAWPELIPASNIWWSRYQKSLQGLLV